MTYLLYSRLAAFSLGVMTTVLLLAPSAKAGCFTGTGMEQIQCMEQESRMRRLEENQRRLESQQQDIERQQQSTFGVFPKRY